MMKKLIKRIIASCGKQPETYIRQQKCNLLKFAGWPSIALASYPRSGNTWMRMMIEEATGLPSGSNYEDRFLNRDNYGIVIKTHHLDRNKYRKAIIITRNPYDCIYSYFKWKTEISSKNKNTTWEEHLRNEIPKYKEHVNHWKKANMPKLWIRYEDIKKNPHKELNKVLKFINYPLIIAKTNKAVEKTTLDTLKNLKHKDSNKFFNKGKSNYAKERYSKVEKKNLMKALASEMENFGYL